MLRSTLLWIFTFLFTVGIAIYQRATGPTYPVKGSTEIGQTQIDFKLVRSHGGETDAPIEIEVPGDDFSGYVMYTRYKSGEKAEIVPLSYADQKLTAALPNQPPAGKLAYDVYIEHNGNVTKLNKEKVIIRFKGAVPWFILYPHILFMFVAMLFSTRTGLEALIKGRRTVLYTTITLVTLLIGGLILGPIVQYYAFGEFWTGWPLGQDLTDNKTLAAFIFWLVAFFKVRKNKNHRTWVVLAAIMLLAVYLIPHSMFGSELDYNSGQIETGNN